MRAEPATAVAIAGNVSGAATGLIRKIFARFGLDPWIIPALRASAFGDGADILDHRNTRIEICRDDHERAAMPGLLGDSPDQVCGDMLRLEFLDAHVKKYLRATVGKL